ncbi:MAG: hypothetical protein R2788_19795 [Saprospiraceae bacterium]
MKAKQITFSDAYPDNPNYLISTYTISMHFSLCCQPRPPDSPLDDYVTGRTSFIDPAVKRGFNLFMGKAACGTCHFAPYSMAQCLLCMMNQNREVLGIPTTPDTMNVEMDQDLGRYASGSLRQGRIFMRAL